jgi:peptide/nickel transport system ATP-binding protein
MTRLPHGCVFAARCPFAEARCTSEPQAAVEIAAGHVARCFKAAGLRASTWPAFAAAPRGGEGPRPGQGHVVAEGLARTFTIGGTLFGIELTRRFGLPWPRLRRHQVKAVDGVTIEIARGEVLGLVGESGSGKSTLARIVLRLIEPSRGRLTFEGRQVSGLARSELGWFRKAAQIVFQNPDSSLNPRRKVGDAIARAVKVHTSVPPSERRRHVEDLMDRVGLARGFYDRYPHQLSGGEKQRVGIARALATDPSFLVCDEPVSALDVSVQATVLNLLADLRDSLGLSYLFISHDLSVVAHLSDRIGVMYAGRIVEIGPSRAVLEPPYHPYTEVLLAALPRIDVARAPRAGTTPRTETAKRAASGCAFHPRCPRKLGSICETKSPQLEAAGDGHAIACHIPRHVLAAAPSLFPTTEASR